MATVYQNALAFRIWRYAKPRQWKVGVAELAVALNAHPTSVLKEVRRRGWDGRIRTHSESARTAYEIGRARGGQFNGRISVDVFMRENTKGVDLDS